MGNKQHQFVASIVTKRKFERELKEYELHCEAFRKKGVVLLEQKDLCISFLFGVPNLNPMAVAYGVKLDYSNWDIEPPSIQFINPFTGDQLKRENIPMQFIQINSAESPSVQDGNINGIDLLQANSNYPPFFCVPGVKEYHNHFAHSGDLWLTHRNKGEGKLVTLLNQLWRHSVAQIGSYNHQLQNIHVNQNTLNIQISVNTIGFKPDLTKL